MSPRVKFLDPREVEETIAEVAAEASTYQVMTAVIGGVAMACYGSDRMTKDVDVAAERPIPAPSLPVIKILSFGGYTTRTHLGCYVDVVVRNDVYRKLYEEAIAEAADVGLPLPVVTREHLVALKMAASRPKDVLDLKTLILLGELDMAKARTIVATHLGPYAARELDALVAETLWEKSRENV